MAFVAPDYFAGALDPRQGASTLFATAGWIRRRCNEIIAEAELDVVKIYDLASNCFLFRAEADRWRSGGNLTQVREALVKLTQDAGIGNAAKTPAEINTDYNDLYVAAGAFLTWATNNLPAAGTQIVTPTVTVNRTWPSPDLTVRVPKAAAVTNQVTTLRNVFA